MLKVGAGKPVAESVKLPLANCWKIAVAVPLLNEGARLTSWLSAALVLVL